MSLKKQFISGTIYIAITRYLGMIIQLFITGILSRILCPKDFGLVAITSVFVLFFEMLADMGVGPGIIQHTNLSKKDIQSIFTFTCFIGLLFTTIFIIFSSHIGFFYEEPILIDMCKVLSIGLFFTCLNIVPNSLLLQKKMFKFLMYRQLIIQVLSGTVGIIAAIKGFGVYALVIYALTSSLFTFSANYSKIPIKFSKIHSSSLKKIMKFSFYQFLFNFISFFSRNLDNLLTGKYLSPVMLAYYEKSYRLMLLPVEKLTHVMSPAIQPFFNKYQNEKQKIFSMYLRIIKILSLIGFPLSIYLYFSSSELILIIFGNQWQASIPVFKIFAWSIGFQIVLSSAASIFQAANDTKRLFLFGLARAIFTVSAICIGIFIIKSIEGIALCLCGAFVISFILGYYILIKITLKSSLLRFAKIFIYPLTISVLLFLFEYILAGIYNENIYISLCIKTLIGAIIFLPMAIPVLKKELLR